MKILYKAMKQPWDSSWTTNHHANLVDVNGNTLTTIIYPESAKCPIDFEERIGGLKYKMRLSTRISFKVTNTKN